MSAAQKPVPPISRLSDPDMKAALAALVRAAQRARELAARTNTPLIVVRNGKLIREFQEEGQVKPSTALDQHRNEIRRIVEKHGACNPRVFGSAIHGDDTETSDLDLLVDPIAGKTTLATLARIQREVESLTGVETDILTPMALHERYRQSVLAEAVPL